MSEGNFSRTFEAVVGTARTVGELRDILGPFTPDCPISIGKKENIEAVYTAKNGEGRIILR